MKIIVLADTHSKPLAKTLEDEIRSADLVIHAGDMADVDLYHRLKGLNDIRAVYGNVDGLELRELLPKQAVLEYEGVRIGLAHGEGSPDGVIGRLQAAFKGMGVQVIVFGHTHAPCHEMIDGILFFNPGSPTDTVRAPYLSYGILEVKDGRVKAKIVKLK